MKRTAIGLLTVFILTFMPLAKYAIAADDQEPPILAKDLKMLEVPGKVVAVVWTVRPKLCTLQIVFSNRPPAQNVADFRKVQPPSVQAWLLRADGSAIPSTGRAEPNAPNKLRQPLGVEVLLGFPLSADTEAVAVALRVDDQFLIERFPPAQT